MGEMIHRKYDRKNVEITKKIKKRLPWQYPQGDFSKRWRDTQPKEMEKGQEEILGKYTLELK